ncbi:MAG: hypothetical protein RR630_01245 [Coprobacillus sp.]
MKNKIYKTILSFACVLTLMGQSLSFVSASSKYYQITYAPGTTGQFKETLIQDYKKVYGAKNVSLSKATGSITIKVAAKKTMPNAPTAQDITLKDTSKQYYVLTSGWQPASTTVSENATYVVQYGALTQGVEYSIRYVDNTTKQDVASPVFARANVNEVMNAYAKNIDGYTFDTQTKSITLTTDAKQNVLTFLYTAKENTVVVDEVEENTVIRNQVVTVPNNNANNNNNVNTPNNDQIINDDDVPLDNGGNDQTIEDGEIPLAKGDELTTNNQMLYGGIVIAGLAIVVVLIAIKRKRTNKA